ncbi:MAG TPA: condensation domain-containing protein, partial [Longimicrobium sp.]|uniref:condensation domain-containing protein n=1 Tax=Longimicrobium sp. TaxID=2029185 RepID=UPI002ED8E7FA
MTAGSAALTDAEKRALLARLLEEARPDTFPLSFAQERLWFLDRLSPGTAAYNVPLSLRLSGPLDPAALRRALGEVAARHPSLRTTIEVVDGEPRQRVAPAADVLLPLRDLAALPAPEREAALHDAVHRQARAPFRLEQGPLFRAELLRTAPDEHVLLLVLHHVITDGWSTGVLLRELAALYGAFVRGRPSPLPPLPLQYGDYAVWQRERLRGAVLERELEWWRARLAGAPTLLELPTDRPRPAVQSLRGGVCRATLPPELARALEALGRREGATLFMVLLAALKALLSRYAGQDDVVVGSAVAGRTRAETEPLIGLFANTLALRTDLSGDPSFRALLRRVRDTALEAYAHPDLPFEKLVAELGIERSLSHTPLLQVVVTAAAQAEGVPREMGGCRVAAAAVDSGATKFDLALGIAHTEAGVELGAAYAAELFDAATVERMLGHLRVLLEAAAADPGRRLSRLPLMPEAERRRVLGAWSAAPPLPVPSAGVHELFQAQAGRAPDAVALVSGGESLTYGALNRRANRLARHLRSRGVGPETRVGVCVERGVEMVEALLG